MSGSVIARAYPDKMGEPAFAETVFRALETLENTYGPSFVLGLSGGGDSMALACLCADWAARTNVGVHAVCVDHGLRPSSAADAAKAAHWAEKLGLASSVMTLEGPWPAARLQETARQRRHQALTREAMRLKSKVILLGHTADDQAETIAFRLSRQTGLDGLAGMDQLSPAPFFDVEWPCVIARPLLSVRREALRTDLFARGQHWLEDPANENMAFSRIKTRHRLASLGQTERLLAIGTHARLLRTAQDEAARRLLSSANLQITANQARLDVSVWDQADLALKIRTLRWLIAAISAAPALPEEAKTQKLCLALGEVSFKAATLQSAKITKAGGELRITRAPARRQTVPLLEGAISAQNGAPAHRLAALSGDLSAFVTSLR